MPPRKNGKVEGGDKKNLAISSFPGTVTCKEGRKRSMVESPSTFQEKNILSKTPLKLQKTKKPKDTFFDSKDTLEEIRSIDTPPRGKKTVMSFYESKPLTPSTSKVSTMDSSLVLDIGTALKTGDPSMGLSALESVITLRKEYPTTLLFSELIEAILTTDQVRFDDAYDIYQALVAAFDQAALCSTAIEYPATWEVVFNVLQDLVIQEMDEDWHRKLLVLQFYVYCLKQNHLFYEKIELESDESASNEHWTAHTWISQLICGSSSVTSKQTRTKDSCIMAGVGKILALWKRIYISEMNNILAADDSYDEEDGAISSASKLTLYHNCCVASVRLLEMLCMLSDQMDNITTALRSGLANFKPLTQRCFVHTIQDTNLKLCMVTAEIGLTQIPRHKDPFWYSTSIAAQLATKEFRRSTREIPDHQLNGTPKRSKKQSRSELINMLEYSRTHFGYLMNKENQCINPLLMQLMKEIEN